MEPEAVIPRSKPPQTPRWVWILALVIGAACAVAFVVAAVRGGDATSTAKPAPSATSSFPTGLVLGLGAGIAIGFALGRRRRG